MIPLKSFYFIRHGETDWNKSGTIMGSKDIELNSRGISQAESARDFLKDEPIEQIYSSSLKRAHHTADIINENLNVPIAYTDLLQERHFGDSEGSHVDQFHEIFALSIDQIQDKDLPKNAETWTHFRLRIVTAFTDILTKSEKSPLIVAHGGVFLGITAILGIHGVRAKNCEPYLFRPLHEQSGKWNVVSLSDPEYDF
jgi:broad specificity phosphatase PhoE